jgi:hypothetical protein
VTSPARASRAPRSTRRRPSTGASRTRRHEVADKQQPPDLDLPGQAAAVWLTVVAALEQSGFAQAGPEYLKLSRILLEQRALDFAAGKPADEQWLALRQAAADALALLEPLHQAATRLTQLPIDAIPAQPPQNQ